MERTESVTESPASIQTRLRQPGPLLNERGELACAGYATRPLLSYERAAIGASPWRIKEWSE